MWRKVDKNVINMTRNIRPSVVILSIAGLYSIYMGITLNTEIKYAFLFAGIFCEVTAYLIYRMYN